MCVYNVNGCKAREESSEKEFFFLSRKMTRRSIDDYILLTDNKEKKFVLRFAFLLKKKKGISEFLTQKKKGKGKPVTETRIYNKSFKNKNKKCNKAALEHTAINLIYILENLPLLQD